jgi:hypothetical protein
MDENIITWNIPNWITIVLMAGLGFAVLGFATKALVKSKGSGDA